MKKFFQLLLCFQFLWVFALSSQTIKVEVYQGAEIVPLAAELAKISNIAFKEYPYLYDIEDDERFYLTKYCGFEEAKLCLARDGTKVIGYAIGVPLKNYTPSFQQPFLNQKLNIDEFFYIGELAILPEYRRQKIGTQLMFQIEEQVKQEQKYPKICLIHIDENKIFAEKPKDFPSANFWIRLGYLQQPSLSIDLDWKNVGETEETPHTLIYWTK